MTFQKLVICLRSGPCCSLGFSVGKLYPGPSYNLFSFPFQLSDLMVFKRMVKEQNGSKVPVLLKIYPRGARSPRAISASAHSPNYSLPSMDPSLLTTFLVLDRRKTGMRRKCRQQNCKNQRSIRAILEDTGATTPPIVCLCR